MNFIKKYNHQILKAYPKIWISGLHIILPILLTLWLLSYIVGAALKFDLTGTVDDYDTKYSQAKSIINSVRALLVLILLAIAIFFISRQIKYNNIRVHHRIPYSFSILYFVLYFFTFFGLLYALNLFDQGLINSNNFYEHKFFTLQFKLIDFSNIALGFSGVLYIVCTTSRSDFGAALVRLFLLGPVVSLISVFIFFITKGINIDSDETVIRVIFLLTVLFVGYLSFLSKKTHCKKVIWTFVLFFLTIPAFFVIIGSDAIRDMKTMELKLLIASLIVINTLGFNESFKRKIAYPKGEI